MIARESRDRFPLVDVSGVFVDPPGISRLAVSKEYASLKFESIKNPPLCQRDPTVTRYLDVYFKNTKAGILGQDRDGTLTFLYDADYLQADDASAISFSMPSREEQYSD